MRTFFMLFLGFLSPFSFGQIPDSIKSEIESLVKDSPNRQFNGIVYLSQNEEQPFAIINGYSDIESETALTLKSQFVIGSISKQITATLILLEYEKGNLSLNDPIIKYLPELSQPWAERVTIHHLLTHTHGIQSLNSQTVFEVGSNFQYSQIGFDLLARIIEKMNDDSFSNVSNTLFEKLGLFGTQHPENGSAANLAKGYFRNENGMLEYEKNSFENYVPAGGFVSTAQDLAKWNSLLYSGQMVHDSTFQLMRTRYATREHPIFGEIEYGYGLTFKNGESDIQIGASGYPPGFVSSNFFFPETGINVVILQNVVYGLPDFKSVFYHHLKILEIIRKMNG